MDPDYDLKLLKQLYHGYHLSEPELRRVRIVLQNLIYEYNTRKDRPDNL